MVAGINGHANGAANGSSGNTVIDMRSDTVTQPTAGMREAMSHAVVGDDVFGDDPTVQELEKRVAEMLGKEAGLFVSSGTQGNLLAVGTHCSGRGQEVILGKDSHIFFYEQGGSSFLMGVAFNTVPNLPDGTINLDDIRKVIKPDDPHFAAAKLLVLENTQNKMGGKVLTPDYMKKAGALCKELGLALHIDGARLWNAVVALDIAPADLCREADTVNVCLSKGLGAPIGSVLVGPADFIKRARRLRKALGGGMRQVGILAAAGLYALDNNLKRLKDDHDNAKRLAKGFLHLGLDVTPVDTNMVFWHMDDAPKIVATLGASGIRVLCIDRKTRCRAVPNMHTSSADIDKVVEAVAAALKSEVPPQKRARSDEEPMRPTLALAFVPGSVPQDDRPSPG
eukprot:CAMPEP_0204229278 /NCGR_PEP_ID=MMETSP0361-20130328/87087_1 /ASSEMBLY_ACC=CAM_ASM_000343 /TAXON_ID=268821 /ORGANISM="Scrippsiella Hangoei, Strain SHTV-5" /LENGTH=395 /DNA_ID=CAMNT_0051197679 /DNA_START=50 /DNA_END=1235 /DNA_ORIENTATION=+